MRSGPPPLRVRRSRRRWLLCCAISLFLLIMTGGQWIHPRSLHTFDAPSFFPTTTVTVYEYVEDTPKPTPVAVLPKVQEHLAARSPPECEVKPLELAKPKHFRLSDSLFPLSEKNSESWASENNRMIKDLFRCLEDDCAANQDKVVILGSYHFRGALAGWTGGEDLWSRSTIQALQNMNYTILYSLNTDRAVQLYQTFPQLVKAVFLEPPDVWECYRDEESCVQSERNPHGIPIWKLFSWHFWAHIDHPLGPKWTLNPEPYNMDIPWSINTHVGYSVQLSCLAHSFVPPSERKNQAYAMAKRLKYFSNIPEKAWDADFYTAAVEETGINIIVGASNEPNLDKGLQVTLPEGLTNIGLLPQHEFLEEIAHSKVLIGVGQPYTSPTPYEALCLGVPFINPILQWDANDPDDRRKWVSQHSMLKYLDPPYVYNVRKDDKEGFVAAIQDAADDPIGRYIEPRMELKAVQERLADILETDWEEEWWSLDDDEGSG